MRVLFLKGGAGSGNYGHAGRPGKAGGSASSSHIKTAAAARAFWMEHFAGKTINFAVSIKGKEHAISVLFAASNHHAWTREALGDEEAVL